MKHRRPGDFLRVQKASGQSEPYLVGEGKTGCEIVLDNRGFGCTMDCCGPTEEGETMANGRKLTKGKEIKGMPVWAEPDPPREYRYERWLIRIRDAAEPSASSEKHHTRAGRYTRLGFGFSERSCSYPLPFDYFQRSGGIT